MFNRQGSTAGSQGSMYNVVNRGPAGAGWLGGLFTGASQLAEQEAYNRIHMGNAGKVGQSVIKLPGMAAYAEPGTNRLVEPADADGTFYAQDKEYLSDQAAVVNEKRKWAAECFRLWFVDDRILLECTSDRFLRACAGGQDGGDLVEGPPMEPELKAASCVPSILNFWPSDSPQFHLGSAKALFLIMRHKHARGRFFVGNGTTHREHQRSAKSAIEEAVA